MKIFDNKEQKKEDIKKIFINKQSNTWYFESEKGKYTLAPALITQYSMSPLIAGADKAILFGCKYKSIDAEKGIYLYFSEELFLNVDVRLEFNKKMFDGWVYDVFSEKIKVEVGQKIWACSYLKIYYSEPPKTIYLRLENT